MFETKSVMQMDIITVNRQTPVSQVVELLLEKNITGLPVVNDDMTLAGIISEKDILGLLLEMEEDSSIVEDYMTQDVVSFNQDEDFVVICDCLINSHFRRVPILADGKLVGIISRRDVIKYVFEPLEYS